MKKQYYAIGLDDFTDEVWVCLERGQDGGAGHYARFTGTKEECVQKCVGLLRALVEKTMYLSDDYGLATHLGKS